MKAAVINTYGPPETVQVLDIPKPKIGDSDVLVKVVASAVTAADSRIRGARFPKGFGVLARLAFGLVRPRVKVLGSAYSGIVDEVGKNVTDLKPGDEVCGMIGIKMGAHAEFIRVGQKKIVKKPAGVSHEDAAGLLFGGTAALYFVRDRLHVSKNDKTVVNGASGAVGTNAVQLAKYFGAEVTGVTSGDNAKLVTDIGAAHIIDYTKQDLASSGQKYDVVIDTVGNISPKTALSLLTNNGRAGLMVASLGEMFASRGPVKAGTASEKKEDMTFLLSLLEQGAMRVVIDKVYDLKDIAAAHAYVDTGKKVGNIIIKM